MSDRPIQPMPPREELAILQELALTQAPRGIDLGSAEARRASRERLQALFIGLQQAIRPALTLEIGAHNANFSQRMTRLGIEAHAFEANPDIFAHFSAALAQKMPGLRYHHLAVCDLDGEVRFEVKISHGGTDFKPTARNNSLLRRSDPLFSYASVAVPATRLDSFLRAQGLEGRGFSAWVDVEGAFGPVSAGFGRALGDCLSLLVEVEEIAYWQGQMLLGDVMRYLQGQGLVPVARDFEGQHQYNLLYLRPDLLTRPDVGAALASHYGMALDQAPWTAESLLPSGSRT